MSKRIDFADLARRLRGFVAVDREQRGTLLERTIEEAAEVLDRIGPAIDGMPEVIELNRADAVHKTVMNIAEVAEIAARDYFHGKKPITTAHGALRMFAASLRESQKPKEQVEAEAKKPLILQ